VQADEVGLGFPVKIPACDFHDLISVAVARSGCVLEPPDARVFLVLIVFLRWFLDHVHRTFDEMCVRT
jgi:hypothetical protein